MITLYDEDRLLNEDQRQVIMLAADSAFGFEGKRGLADIAILREEDMRARNQESRGQDCVTDVLSFPMAQPGEAPPDGFFGDICICFQQAKEQAMAYGHPLERELAFLTVHGILHLFGYDHMESGEAACMEQKQNIILERIAITR